MVLVLYSSDLLLAQDLVHGLEREMQDRFDDVEGEDILAVLQSCLLFALLLVELHLEDASVEDLRLLREEHFHFNFVVAELTIARQKLRLRTFLQNLHHHLCILRALLHDVSKLV